MGVIVESSYGKLQGTVEDDLCVFRGIPYARPPIGGQRFQAPQRRAAWGGVRDATSFGNPPAQNPSLLGPMLSMDIGTPSEDCLYLNVWTPGSSGRRPVMVWIHGGAFVMGAGSQLIYHGARLARRGDVVLVTINYRLGALGFLHLRELCGEAFPLDENLGLLDQIAALEWVRDEIAAFGGDPENVTIFGESAGSISVATLLGTPRARGLFQRAILQSGSANFVSSRAQATRVGEELVREIGLTPGSAEKLRSAPVEQLLAAQQRVFLNLAPQTSGLPFQPVIDGSLLSQHPFATIGDGLSKDVAVLAGTNLDEMKLFGLMDQQVRGLDEQTLLARCERRVPGAAAGMTHGRRLVDTYSQARAERGESTVPSEMWFAIDSDRAFRYPAMRLAELQAAHQSQTYTYLFTWPSPFLGGQLGACHALELPFVFGVLDKPLIGNFTGTGAAADALSDRMQEAWVSFAHSGTPSSLHLETWMPYDRQRRATMVLGASCQLEAAPREPERRVWESIF